MQAHAAKDTCVVRKTHSAWDSALYACRYTPEYDACILHGRNIHQGSDYTHVERRRGHVDTSGRVRCLNDQDAL
nr:MAG TPA: hypothetical protein [Caudoviricetes sp.]